MVFVDFRGHADRFAQGRMRVDGERDVGRFADHLDGQRQPGDQVAGIHAVWRRFHHTS